MYLKVSNEELGHSISKLSSSAMLKVVWDAFKDVSELFIRLRREWWELWRELANRSCISCRILRASSTICRASCLTPLVDSTDWWILVLKFLASRRAQSISERETEAAWGLCGELGGFIVNRILEGVWWESQLLVRSFKACVWWLKWDGVCVCQILWVCLIRCWEVPLTELFSSMYVEYQYWSTQFWSRHAGLDASPKNV